MRWDMRCERCGRIQEVHDRRVQTFCECGSEMVWVPTPTPFVVNGFSAKNGYSHATKKE
jgi:hypothetical protein